MPNAIVLGAGMVGSVMAWDLASDSDFSVTVADRSEDALERTKARSPERLETAVLDLSDLDAVKKAIGPFDIVLGAAASHLGYDLLRTVIECGKNYADISFMPEDAMDHDELAKANGVTAVVDCGVAPGMSNLLCGRAVADRIAPSAITSRPFSASPMPVVSSDTLGGAKKSEMPSICSSVVAFSNHSNRKNAIMAVTKSA